jgi:hypothetical protein
LPTCWVDLSGNSKDNPWLFFTLKLKTSEPFEKFMVKSSSIYLFCLDRLVCIFNIHTRDCFQFWSKMKARKSQGLSLSWTQVNSSCGQINVALVIHFHSMHLF